ncbi:hypothetical protein GCM10017044_05350 [Kordiimonas sediminis]|uniref:Uncharacterized protein n=1 Tax=Kordiimonas sediminis TaxID=1735581 RepID=A0A919E4X4_9PROT|nr:hypothetical protein GCM10017044_05350 [Kordiimonas sediminis]
MVTDWIGGIVTFVGVRLLHYAVNYIAISNNYDAICNNREPVFGAFPVYGGGCGPNNVKCNGFIKE